MLKYFFIFCNIIFFSLLASCAEKPVFKFSVQPIPPLADVPLAGALPARTVPDSESSFNRPINHEWRFRFDDADTGVTSRWFADNATAGWTPIAVPAAWDLALSTGFNRQTIGWYQVEFTADSSDKLPQILGFDGVFRSAEVWLNGERLGGSDLPYLPLYFDVSKGIKKGSNRLVVRIDNRLTWTSLPSDTVFNPGKHGWFPYGGIFRPVWLRNIPSSLPWQVLIRTRNSGVAFVDLYWRKDMPVSTRSLQLSVMDPWGTVQFSKKVNAASDIRLTVPLEDPATWLPGVSKNYSLKLVDTDGYSASWDFAFRKEEIKNNHFFLNGKDLFLHGINRHEDHPVFGPTFNEEAMNTDMSLIKTLGVNFIRPGHYPNDIRGLRMMEQAGLMIAEEIPVYQWSNEQMGNDEMIDRAERALRSMIIRDYNRPGIVVWSVANEIHNWAPNSKTFIRRLYKAAKELDPDRMVMVAAVTIPLLSEQDISSDEVDIVGINQYYGWYYGNTNDAGNYYDRIRERFPRQMVFVSEFGAGASAGTHLNGVAGEEPSNDHSYSEEFQQYFFEQHLRQIATRPWLRGAMPWVFADFRMQWTPTTGKPHPQPLMNLKGLVSFDRNKKQAFETVREFYYSHTGNRAP